MRLHIVRHILWKDLRETLRDRRTVFLSLLLPALLYPVLFTLMGSFASDKRVQLERMRPRLALWGAFPDTARTTLESEARADLVDVRADVPPDAAVEARRMIATKRIHVALVASQEASGPSRTVRVLTDSNDFDSGALGRRVIGALESTGTQLLRTHLTELRQDPGWARPLQVKEEDVAERRGAKVLAIMLPYLLLTLVLVSGFYAAVDLTAGEKERGTLQTLLSAPVHSVEIVAGKFLAVLALALAATACNLASIALALARSAVELGAPGTFSLGLGGATLAFISVVPAALLIVSLLMAVGVMARSYKEGQSYLTPVLVLVVLAASVTGLPGVELTRTTALIPLVNVALLMHDLLVGKLDLGLMSQVWVVSLAWAALGVCLVAKVFQTEQVLLSGEKPWRDVFSGPRGGKGLTPGNAVLFSAVLLTLGFYGSVLFQRTRHVGSWIAILQLGLILLPSLIWLRVFGVSPREALQLRWPTPRGWAATALLASGAWSVSAVLSGLLHRFPAARDYADQLNELFGKHGQLSLGAALILVAVLPAVAEEFAFRGIVLAGLRRSGSRWIAVLGSAAVFGLFHFNPYHMVAAFVVGLLLGFVALESGSIVPVVLMHLVNNGLLVLADRWPALEAGVSGQRILIPALVATAAGLWLVRGSRPVSGPMRTQWAQVAASRQDGFPPTTSVSVRLR